MWPKTISFLTAEKSLECFCQISVACSAPKYYSVTYVVEKLAAKQGQLTKVANRKKTLNMYTCWPRIAWLWSHWVVVCYALIAPHPPSSPKPFSILKQRPGLGGVDNVLEGGWGADMALGHGWCTILLLLGNNEKLPPVALDHRWTTAMLSEERWLAWWSLLAFSRGARWRTT